jgi:hypothetical protein
MRAAGMRPRLEIIDMERKCGFMMLLLEKVFWVSDLFEKWSWNHLTGDTDSSAGQTRSSPPGSTVARYSG